jgi:hypothetical protein
MWISHFPLPPKIANGSFGLGRNQDLRRQVRALMAVTERALQAQPLESDWKSTGYDPRAPLRNK